MRTTEDFAIQGDDLSLSLYFVPFKPNNVCAAVKKEVVQCTLEIGYAIMQESGLSFLGFGIHAPTPSWGNLLSNAQEHLTRHPWLAIFPGLMIFLTIISFNYIGDGLRDALDPYKVLE